MTRNIKNRTLRLLTSFVLVIIFFFSGTLIGVKGDLEEVFKVMLTLFVFTFFLSIPIIGIVFYKIYNWLTPIEERSEEEALKNKKKIKAVVIVLVIAMLILLFALSSN